MARKIAFVLKGYPRLSETFIAQEILALERLGLDLSIVSLRHPTDPQTHPVHGEIRAAIGYLPEYLKDAPRRVLNGLKAARALPKFRQARAVWWRDLIRDPTANRVRRFGQACVLAAELPSDIEHIHAHFLHTPASVARYAAKMRGLPWSVSAHAVDIWTSPDWEKREKLEDAAFCTTCTAIGRDHLAALVPHKDNVVLVYHGLDLTRFPPSGRDFARDRDGSRPERAVNILSVGRAVEKKGFDVLLAALGGLKAGLHWRLIHIGGGAGLETLRAQARNLGIADRVQFRGPQAFDEVRAAYGAADLFVLPCRIAGNGDRDGLPNVLMEAQSQSLAVISTTVSAVPELVVHGTTGLLVPPDDASMLTQALESLITDPALRIRYGAAGAQRVSQAFSQDALIGELAALFGLDTPAAAGGSLETGERLCASPSMHP
ncbi:MAG: colanic acid biosynthesis glycosyltransferase WcaL [Alphaproteobacteria bacterium]|nr:MAG: colanic acid biosynthesis glycosyltransferase WcaL [Alphaproteobacteria bacterium]